MDNMYLYYSIGILLGFFLITLPFVWHSHFYVEEGHKAVLTRFGAVIRENRPIDSIAESCSGDIRIDFPENDIIQLNRENQIKRKNMKMFSPGFHSKMPWDRVIKFSVMERVLDLTGEKSGQQALTSDGTTLRLDSKIRFSSIDKLLYIYLFEIKRPMAHIKELFTCLIRNEIGNFQGSNNSEEISIGSYSEIRRDQTRFNSQLEALCRTHFGPKYGIEFHGVDLIAILPPPELVDAFNSIQKATTAAVAMYNHAEAASKQKIMAEEGGLEISKVKAQAVALELRSLINGVLKLRQNHQFENYLEHKRQEILGNSRLTFIQDGELK